MKRSIVILFVLSLGLNSLFAQDSTSVDTLAQTFVDSVQGIRPVVSTTRLGMLNVNSETSPFSLVRLENESFNKGYISNAGQTIQSLVPGLQVYQIDGSPNASTFLRLRGTNSALPTSPLIVVDGVPDVILESIDPDDIESIEVIKDAAGSAIYGARGGRGVILITTKRFQEEGLLNVRYSGQGLRSSLSNSLPLLNAQEFIAKGGNDLGGSTNWLEEITQSPFSQQHHLDLSGSKDFFNYFISGNFRKADGILINTGFEKKGVRGKVGFDLLKDKLKINVFGNTLNNVQSLGYNEAFKQSTTYNPTAPVRSSDFDLWNIDSTRFGGYFQALGLFDAYNPVSIQKLNRNIRRTSYNQVGGEIKLQVVDGLEINIVGSKQRQIVNTRDLREVQILCSVDFRRLLILKIGGGYNCPVTVFLQHGLE